LGKKEVLGILEERRRKWWY